MYIGLIYLIQFHVMGSNLNEDISWEEQECNGNFIRFSYLSCLFLISYTIILIHLCSIAATHAMNWPVVSKVCLLLKKKKVVVCVTYTLKSVGAFYAVLIPVLYFTFFRKYILSARLTDTLRKTGQSVRKSGGSDKHNIQRKSLLLSTSFQKHI